MGAPSSEVEKLANGGPVGVVCRCLSRLASTDSVRHLISATDSSGTERSLLANGDGGVPPLRVIRKRGRRTNQLGGAGREIWQHRSWRITVFSFD